MIPDTVENCVSCGEETPYKFSDSIFIRNWYVEGAGQLCKSCYDKVYTDNFNILRDIYLKASILIKTL